MTDMIRKKISYDFRCASSDRDKKPLFLTVSHYFNDRNHFFSDAKRDNMKLIFTVLILFALCYSGSYSMTFRRAQKRLQQAATTFFSSLQPGICAKVILNETVRHRYIAKRLIGRVEPVGTFTTTETALEYLYGLICDIPGLPPRREVLESSDLLHLTYDPEYYRVSFKLQLNLKSTKKLLFFGMLAFNRQLKVCGYEAVVQHAGLTLDFNSTIRPVLLNTLCQGAQFLCPVGTSREQYANFSDCMSFLSEPQTPFGSYDRGDQNNVVCRLIHLQLAQIAPDIHCPHLGKEGGGKCTNKNSTYYFTGTTDFLTCAHRYQD